MTTDVTDVIAKAISTAHLDGDDIKSRAIEAAEAFAAANAAYVNEFSRLEVMRKEGAKG